MRNNEKKPRGKNWKDYCTKKSCTGCSDIFFVRSANRYCYENRFNLPQVPHKIIYKLRGKVHVVATGIIGHATYNTGEHGQEKNASKAVWEDNMVASVPKNDDNYLHIIQETCHELKIDFKKFMRTLNKIAKEVME